MHHHGHQRDCRNARSVRHRLPAVSPFFGGAKNSVSGPGNWRLNASLFKDFRTFHEQRLEFRADAFNVLNHPSLGNPGSTTTDIGCQRGRDYRDRVQPEPHHRRTLLPVVRKVRVLN